MTDEPVMPGPVPPDIVPRNPVTAAAIRLLDTAQHQPVTITIPGDVLTDPEGVPVGMTEPRTVTGLLAARVARADITRTGLTEEEVPNVRITD